MYPVSTIISFFLSKETMTPKKLQKLLYYAYAWTLTLLNDSIDSINSKLFNERIEAWVHGPAIPSVYDLFKRYGGKSIPQAQPFVESLVSPDILDILEQVWSVYGSFTGNQLEELTHRETPWLQARANLPAYAASSEAISDKEIYKYYCIQAIS